MKSSWSLPEGSQSWSKELMSRLIDKFHKAARSSVQPMGFNISRNAALEPGLLILVSIAPDAVKNNNEIRRASGILLRRDSSPLTASGIKKIVEDLPDVPVGLYLEDADNQEEKSLAEIGCDFLAFPASSRVFAPSTDKKTGHILEVDSAMDDSLLRAVNSLPVDAVLLSDTFAGGALVWHDLMIFQHLANTLAKPLIINIPADITPEELKAVWEAGADAVVVEASAMKAGGLKKLREDVGKLPPRTARKRGVVDVILPRTGGEPHVAPSPDEEEEEE
jgi:hypothetical protein